ncbi:MAG: TRAP transporter small permease [Lachnospiraceae bacterium]|nr:TRAP transporter small permease [Lachnospiraceae bacterium]
MKLLHTIRDTLLGIIGGAAVILLAFMTVVGTWQIVSRYVFNRPSTVSEELLTYSFAWMALLSSAYVFGKRDHMRMGFLADKAGERARRFLGVAADVCAFAFAAVVMVYGGVEITRLTMTQVTASLQIPMGYIYVILPAAGFLIMFFSLVNACDVLTGAYSGIWRDGKEAEKA